MKIAIIGTAGRRDDKQKMSKHLYKKMFCKTKELINELTKASKDNRLVLVSGGAAWSDHLAVSLFLEKFKNCKLELHLPTSFIPTQLPKSFAPNLPGYLDTGEKNFRVNPGGTLNYYHNLFSKKMGGNTLKGLARSYLHEKCKSYIYSGMFERNSSIAKNCDVLIAFTFNKGSTPKAGGTLDTWKKCKASKKIHINLGDL